MIKKYQKNINVICFFSIIFSALGYIVENVSRIFSYGIIDNRFHFLPFIGVYGLIPFAFVIIGNPDRLKYFGNPIFKKDNKKNRILSNIIYILMISFFVCFGEITVGTLYEKIAGVKLWDYSNKWLHVTDYTCALSIVGFSIGAYLIAKFIFFPLYNYMMKNVNNSTVKSFRYVYGILLIDMINMMLITFITKEKSIYYQFILNDTVKKGSILLIFLAGYILLLSVILITSFALGKHFKKNSYINNANEQIDAV